MCLQKYDLYLGSSVTSHCCCYCCGVEFPGLVLWSLCRSHFLNVSLTFKLNTNCICIQIVYTCSVAIFPNSCKIPLILHFCTLPYLTIAVPRQEMAWCLVGVSTVKHLWRSCKNKLFNFCNDFLFTFYRRFTTDAWVMRVAESWIDLWTESTSLQAASLFCFSSHRLV